MALMFKSEAFSDFLGIIEEKQAEDLRELIEPVLKSEKLSNNEYTFLLRGRIEAYEEIKEEIKRIISLFQDYAIQD